MENNRYKYQGEPLTISKVEQLILTLFAGMPAIKREYIIDGVIEFHKSQGGLEPSSTAYPFPPALTKLKEKGFAEQLGGGYWRILSIYDYDSEA